MLVPDEDAFIPIVAFIEKPPLARQLAEVKVPIAKLWLYTE
jgi:hypothetical protein